MRYVEGVDFYTMETLTKPRGSTIFIIYDCKGRVFFEAKIIKTPRIPQMVYEVHNVYKMVYDVGIRLCFFPMGNV